MSMESARPVRLQDVGDSFYGRKVRVAGRVLNYDAETGYMTLFHKGHAVFVDTRLLCLDPVEAGGRWTREAFCIVEVIGTVETPESSVVLPTAVGLIAPRDVIVEERVLLNALIVVDRPGLDLDFFATSIGIVDLAMAAPEKEMN